MNADSIPSMCVNCFVNYHRDDAKNLHKVTMIYFCASCRTALTKKEWAWMEEVAKLIAIAWANYNDCSRPSNPDVYDVDFREGRTQVLRTIYQSFLNNEGRDKIFPTLQSTKMYPAIGIGVLDLIELLEEYDVIIQEKTNGKKRKTRTDKESD